MALHRWSRAIPFRRARQAGAAVIHLACDSTPITASAKSGMPSGVTASRRAGSAPHSSAPPFSGPASHGFVYTHNAGTATRTSTCVTGGRPHCFAGATPRARTPSRDSASAVGGPSHSFAASPRSGATPSRSAASHSSIPPGALSCNTPAGAAMHDSSSPPRGLSRGFAATSRSSPGSQRSASASSGVSGDGAGHSSPVESVTQAGATPRSCSTPAEACASLWGDGAAPLLTLERSLPAVAAADGELWRSGRFSAGVYPDLPVAASWGGLLQNSVQRCESVVLGLKKP